ncbi:MAG: hypothetical protein WA208_19740 [Thermoanaerobaculia bacterium]
MKRIVISAIVVTTVAVAFLAGFAIGRTSSLSRAPAPELDDPWVFDGALSSKGSIFWTDEALFQSDIALPDVQSTTAKVKFIAPPAGGVASKVIGYVAEIRVAPLAKKDIPARYLRKTTATMPVGVVTTPPLEQVSYSARLVFELLDKDGFKLGEIDGREHSIRSGETNRLQDMSEAAVPASLVQRVTRIRPRLWILKCQSCTAA